MKTLCYLSGDLTKLKRYWLELEKEYGKEVQFIGILGPSKGFDKDIEILKRTQHHL